MTSASDYWEDHLIPSVLFPTMDYVYNKYFKSNKNQIETGNLKSSTSTPKTKQQECSNDYYPLSRNIKLNNSCKLDLPIEENSKNSHNTIPQSTCPLVKVFINMHF
ncbi:hypothetical protein CYY_000912 [Polysphondylium violaceum]|uniref:Uncharacterized protein n=1 Tax=Polysphondylium violaceum TaxID=133409 RepID=A0A8J4UWR1_9MYCE|nr:hypothetical protein CYY_000912 [Polysphondylium violaceum]